METTAAEEKKPLTPEEMVKIKNDHLKFMTEEIPFLKVELEYETLCANIEEQRYKYLTNRIRIAQITTRQPEQTQPVEKKPAE